MPATKPKRKTALEGAAAIDAKECEPLELHALNQVAKQATKVRDRLEPGQAQMVDFTVRITGAMNVGDSQSGKSAERLEAAKIVALVFAALGPRKMTDVIEHAHRACTAFVNGGAEPEVDADCLARAEDLLKTISREVVAPKRGNVTGAIKATVLKRG